MEKEVEFFTATFHPPIGGRGGEQGGGGGKGFLFFDLRW